MTPYDAPIGTVWDFEGELFVMLDEYMRDDECHGDLYRRYLGLVDGKIQWMGQYSLRDDDSKMFT